MIFRNILIFLLCSLLSFSHSINIQIQEEMTLRVSEEKGSRYIGRPVGTLAPGSIVDVPEQYVVKDSNGQVDIDFTLQKWFEEGGRSFFVEEEGLHLFYTPITIVHPSLPHLKGQRIYTGIRDLQLREKGSTLLKVIEDADLISVVEEMKSETEAGSLCTGVCDRPEEILDEKAADLIAQIQQVRRCLDPGGDEATAEKCEQEIGKDKKNAYATSIRIRNNIERGAALLDQNLKSTCGISEKQLCQEMSQAIELNKLPITVQEFAGMVIHESRAGHCLSVNRNTDTADYGLFQINSDNIISDKRKGLVKQCTRDEFNKKAEQARQNGGVQFWKSQPAPQCLFNPMYSLKKAIQVIKEQSQVLRSDLPDQAQDPDLFKRLVLSSYNGGQVNAKRAIRDLLTFNRDLTKKLADGGKDITRSNRGILQIKEEIADLDNNIFHYSQAAARISANIQETQLYLQQARQGIKDSQETIIPHFQASLIAKEKELTQMPQDLAENIRVLSVKYEADRAAVLTELNRISIELTHQLENLSAQYERDKNPITAELGGISEKLNQELQQLDQRHQAQAVQVHRDLVQISQEMSQGLKALQATYREDQGEVDSQIAHIAEEFSQNLQGLNTQHLSDSQAVQTQLNEISKNLEQGLADIEKQKQEKVEAIQKEAENQMTRAAGLAQQWNDLNREDAGIIRSQQNILSFLDGHLTQVRKQLKDSDPLSLEGQKLTLQEETLSRLAQEVEEEKWPYYLDQLGSSSSATSEVADSPTSSQSEAASSSTSPQKTRSSQVIRPVKTAGGGFLNREARFVKNRLHRMRNTAGDFISMFNPEIEDVYNIRALENKLNSLYERKGRNRTLQRMNRRKKTTLVEVNPEEIQSTIQQLEQARQKRASDIEKILDKQYRDSMSSEEMAYALRIIEDQAGSLSFGLGQPGENNFVRRVALFFTPHENEMRELDRAYGHISSQLQKEQRERAALARRQQNQASLNQFIQRSRQQQAQALAQPPQYYTDLADKERKSMSYLRSVLSSSDSFSYLSELNRWRDRRIKVDEQRKSLREQPFFKKITPFLKVSRSADGMQNYSAGAATRHFFADQALNQTHLLTLNPDSVSTGSQIKTDLAIASLHLLEEKLKTAQATLQKQNEADQQRQQDRLKILSENLTAARNRVYQTAEGKTSRAGIRLRELARQLNEARTLARQSAQAKKDVEEAKLLVLNRAFETAQARLENMAQRGTDDRTVELMTLEQSLRKNIQQEQTQSQRRRSSVLSGIEQTHARLRQAQESLQRMQNEKIQYERRMAEAVKIRYEKKSQSQLLEQERDRYEADLAAALKDPLDWEDIKLFYFSRYLKEGLGEDSGLVSRRKPNVAYDNVTYVDSILGSQHHHGFTDTEAGKNICTSSGK